MTIKRLYIENIQNQIILDKPTISYLKKTLRFKGNENILIFDGKQEFKAVFCQDNSIVIQEKIREKENLFLKLAISEIKKEKIEWIIEKSVEIGVKEINILQTQRSKKNYNEKRLQKIAIEACRQSNRISIPNIFYKTLNDFIESSYQNEWCFCSLKNNKNTKIIKNFKGTIIGPEGGWTKEEEKLLSEKFESIYLNKLTLKSETAALASLSLINYINLNQNDI